MLCGDDWFRVVLMCVAMLCSVMFVLCCSVVFVLLGCWLCCSAVVCSDVYARCCIDMFGCA